MHVLRIQILALVLIAALLPGGVAHSSLRDRLTKIVSATEGAAQTCLKTLQTATDQTKGALDKASESAGKILDYFKSLIELVDFSNIADGAMGGAAGAKAVVWDRLSLVDSAKMAYRILTFEPDVKGLREGLFEPMTVFVNRLVAFQAHADSLPTQIRVQRQVELYGDLLILLTEVSLKTYRLVPQVVTETIPNFAGTGIFVTAVKVKNPEGLDELVALVMARFLKNAFQAVTTRDLSLQQRFALLSMDMATIQATTEFAQAAGIADFLAALGRLRNTNSP